MDEGEGGALMSGLLSFLFTAQNWALTPDGVPARLGEHLLYTAITLVIAFVIAFPVGLLIGHTGRGAFLAINIGNAGRALPTLGLLTLLVLLMALGILPVIIALVILAIPPIMTNTYAGIRSVEPDIVDAARGMGMTELQVLFQAELPAALPVIVGGLRTATLQVVSTATVAAYVALGGLGRFLIDGQDQQDYPQMFAGAVLVALLAILLDVVFVGLRYVAAPGGLAARRKTPTRRAASAS
ncbi:MAG: ABC transporter permease [Acidothermales bacterium]|nr:ABC transporter permease [Acidothermales bacterium]